MRRREFIALVGGTAVAWPVVARAQQPAIPVIGWLSARPADQAAHLLAAFHRGLNETGFVESRNVTIEYRWAQGQYDKLPGMAADLVARQVAVIAASGGEPAALAAKAATTTIPTVFIIGTDPIKLGLVTSINRPGGNATGVNLIVAELEAKRLGLLRELIPAPGAIAVLVNPNGQNAVTQLKDVQAAARAIGWQVHILTAGNERGLDDAFSTLVKQRAGALMIIADPLFTRRREHLVALAARYAIPAIYYQRDFTSVGGLISYGPILQDGYRQAGLYTGRILKGAKPADLPVVQSAKFELIINLKTAKALGLEIPAQLLARADDVIE